MDLGFNVNAFVKPRTQAEYSALLDEALRMAIELNEIVDRISELLAQRRANG